MSDYLIQNGKLFNGDKDAPAKECDILIRDGRISRISADPIQVNGETTVIDAKGKWITPGFIDTHTHMSGGGGEAGAATKVPAPLLSTFTTAGVTTAIGLSS